MEFSRFFEPEIYQGIKKFLSETMGAKFDNRKIRLLTFREDRKTYKAELGKQIAINGETVIAILHEPGRQVYHVCTPNRGVLRGVSILVGEYEVERVEDFKGEVKQTDKE